MFELKTEEEQIEAFKSWWKKYGVFFVIVLAIIIGGYFGWQAWQRSQAVYLSKASALYQNMLQSSSDLSEEDNQKTISYIAKKLEEDYGDTGYNMLGQFILTRLEAQKKQYNKAIASLEEAIKLSSDGSFRAIANLRIARILIQKKAYSKALTTLDKVTEIEFSTQRQELLGDIYSLQGKLDEARLAYQKASEVLSDGIKHPLLDIKLKDLVKG